MNTKIRTFILIFSAIIAFIILRSSAFGQCNEDVYFWRTGAGNWSIPENWNHAVWDSESGQCVPAPGVPQADDNAFIVNGGTATITGNASVNVLLLGYPNLGTGNLIQTGNMNAVGVNIDQGSIYELREGSMNVGSLLLNIYGGNLIQTGGSVTPQSFQIQEQGLYELHQGSLETNRVYIGYETVGTFVQTGGNVTTREIFYVDLGMYELLGGTLNAPIIAVGLDRPWQCSGSASFVMNRGTINGTTDYATLSIYGNRGSLIGSGTFNIKVIYKSDEIYGTLGNRSIDITFERNCLIEGGTYDVKRLAPVDFAGGNVPNLLESSVFEVNFDGEFSGESEITIPFDESELNALSMDRMSLVILHETGPGTYERLNTTVGSWYARAKAQTFGKFAVGARGKEFMITFDDGPIRGQTDNILLQLMKFKVDEEPVRAAFFLVGDADPLYCPADFEWPKGSVVEHSDVVVRIDGMKHLVGNHTYHHAWFPQWWVFDFHSMEEFVIDEISDCNEMIEGALGRSPPKIFRAPYLQERDYPSPIYGAALQLGFTVVGGEIADISPWDPNYSLSNVKEKAKNIIEKWKENEPVVLIFHDNRSVTYDHIGEIIDYLLSEGYTLAHFDKERIPRQTQQRGENVSQIFSGTSRGPVDLIITDPEGLMLSKDDSQITMGVYYEMNMGIDDEWNDFFVILRSKAGQYLIQVIPEPNALTGDTYCLKLEYGGDIFILADEVPVSEVPTEPYSFTVTQEADLIVDE